MKTTNFTLKNENLSISGVLIEKSSGSEIFFETKKGDIKPFEDVKIKAKKIKNVRDFIASYIRRVDTEELFDTVTVARTKVGIIREGVAPSKETMKVMIVGDIKNQVILTEQSLKLTTTQGEMETDLFSLIEDKKIVEVPLDLKYVRDEKLNAILAYNVMPIDYDKKTNKSILKALKTIKSKIANITLSPQEYAYVDKFGDLGFAESSRNVIVIPRKFWN